MALLSPVAVYLLYALSKESWGNRERILLIVLLVGGMINSSIVERNRKKEQKGDGQMSNESIRDIDKIGCHEKSLD